MRRAVSAGVPLLFSSVLVAQAAWNPPACDIKPGHFRLNSVSVNFKTAVEKPTQRDRMLAQSLDILNRSLTQDNQTQNPYAWYFLGRYYAEMNDAVGADSAFDRAESLAPQCAQDIAGYRRGLWEDVLNSGQRQQQEGKVDSAARSFRAASALVPANPRPLFLLGSMYAARDQVDSATHYLREAASRSAGDTAFAQARREALSQVARLSLRRVQTAPEVQRWSRTRFSRDSLERVIGVDSAVLSRMDASSAGRRSRGARLSPADQQTFARDSAARAGAVAAAKGNRAPMAQRAAADSAAAQPVIEPALAAARDYVVAAPDDGDGVGVLSYLYAQSARTGDARAAFDSIYRSQPGEVVVEAGRRAIRSGLTGPGAAVLERGLAQAPADRDAWADLANAYRQLRDGPRMVEASRRLVSVDPLNRTAARLLATAWEISGQPDSARRAQARADSGIVVEVAVSSFVRNDNNAVLTAVAANSGGTASAPLRLQFEFLDAAGAVVGSQTAQIPAIPPQGSHQFEVTVAGNSARGWRYRLN